MISSWDKAQMDAGSMPASPANVPLHREDYIMSSNGTGERFTGSHTVRLAFVKLIKLVIAILQLQ